MLKNGSKISFAQKSTDTPVSPHMFASCQNGPVKIFSPLTSFSHRLLQGGSTVPARPSQQVSGPSMQPTQSLPSFRSSANVSSTNVVTTSQQPSRHTSQTLDNRISQSGSELLPASPRADEPSYSNDAQAPVVPKRAPKSKPAARVSGTHASKEDPSADVLMLRFIPAMW